MKNKSRFFIRTSSFCLGLLLFSGLGLYLLTLAQADASLAATWSNPSQTAYNQVVKTFWDNDQGRFRLAYQYGLDLTLGGDCRNIPADYWLSTQALEMLASEYETTRDPQMRLQAKNLMQQYYKNRADNNLFLQQAPWEFYDDENWMGLALVHAGRLIQNEHLIETAKTLFEQIRKGWDQTCCGKSRGGIWWSVVHTQKSTTANSGAIILAAELYQYTANPHYLQFAEKVYNYWIQEMGISIKSNASLNKALSFDAPSTPVRPIIEDRLAIFDHITPDGVKSPAKLSYNEGSMLGAALALYRSTKNPVYLAQARKFANFIMSEESESVPLVGPVISDHALADENFTCNQPSIYTPDHQPNAEEAAQLIQDGMIKSRHKDVPLFKYIAVRYLVELAQIESGVDADYAQKLKTFLNSNALAIWTIARDSQSGLFAANWEKLEPPSISGSLISPAVAAAGALIEISKLR